MVLFEIFPNKYFYNIHKLNNNEYRNNDNYDRRVWFSYLFMTIPN